MLLMFSRRYPLSQIWLAATAAAAVSGATLQAQGEVHATSSASISQQYDTNVFSTAIDPEADLVTRATMGLEVERRTQLWTASARYLQDMERFIDHPDLSSAAARQRGTIALRYRSSLRTFWTADAEIWRTGTPSELNDATGLTVSRASAQRLLAHSSVNRHLSQVTSGTIDYTVTQDHLAGRTSATTHDAIVGMERHRSPRETVSVKYRFREFMFTPAAAGSSFASSSHALTAGWSRAMNSRLQLTLEAGPRLTNSTPAADIAASLHYQRVPDVSLSYARSQATVIGLPVVADVQSLSAAIEWPLWSALRVRLGPGLFRSQLGTATADAGVVSLDVTRPITHAVAVDLSMSSSLQRGGLNPGIANTSINRHVVLVRLIAGPSSLLW
jgi:hypothetical protein